ncbi:alpha-L-rhamnosidase [Prolixibacteraceae bacterium JC049]|nr:alpha-L-rhamnosidase [Prolixibacteraceae bacterium JC049]
MKQISVLILMLCCYNLMAIEVKKLRTEYLKNPMGIEAEAPRLSWEVRAERNGVAQSAYEIRCAESVKKLKHRKALLWSTGKVLSNKTTLLEYGGEALASGQRVYWQVRVWDEKGKASKWSEPAFFEMGLLKKEDWKAGWIHANSPSFKAEAINASPYFRKEFSTNKKVVRARAYVSAQGLYELYLNGEKVGNDRLTPGWTSYENRIQYQVYDVTSMIGQGENVVASVLGNGWYREFRNQNMKKPLTFILQMDVNYSDGSSELIVTDDTWKSALGAIEYTSIYNGEQYNATKELKNWNRVGAVSSVWTNALVVDVATQLVATENETMQVMNRIQPVEIKETESGSYIIDFGQNLVGVMEIQLNGKGHKGEVVTLHHAEVLEPNGKLYRKALRRAQQTDNYTIAGEETEKYTPRFTFHGFRYAEVIGYPGKLQKENITALAIHSNLEETGQFECSEPLINQLVHNAVWGQKGNFVDVPTDCPQRDERLGWTADTQVFTPAGCFNMQSAAFYMKWMKDLALDQNRDGSVPRYIPAISHGGGQAGWSDAAVIVPWYLYHFYGDTTVLREQYDSMKRHIEFMKNRAGKNLLIQKGKQYGDWLSFKSENNDHYMGAFTDKYFIATAYFSYSSALVAKIAHILGEQADEKYYTELAAKVRKAFQNEYMTANGRLMSNTQTAYCMGIEFDLVPEALKPQVAKYLANDVNKMKHITTGFLGTPMISFILSEYGYYDEAYMLLMRKKYPGWLYPVTKGATTIWERWDGIRPDGSFQRAGMNSFNHYAYGAIVNWLYQVVAGIRIDERNAGFSEVVIEPHVGGGLTWAKASYNSIRGTIKSAWKMENDHFELNVEVPVNTKGVIRIVAEETDTITKNGESLKRAQMKYISTASFKGYEINVASGKYSFVRK